MKIEEGIKSAGRKPKILGTGLIALDIVLSAESEASFIQTGGTCGNILTILSFLRWRSFPIARLGNDFASQRVLNDIKQWDVSLKFVDIDPKASTPIIIQTISKHKSGQIRHKFSFNCPNCGAWLPSYKPVLAKTAKQIASDLDEAIEVFFFDRVSRASLILAESCARNGAVVVFEPVSVGDPKLFKEALSLSHILKYSNDRFQVSPIDQFDIKECLIEIQTLGSEGLQYRTSLYNQNSQKWHFLKGFKANIIKDTAGAGDWCTAGIIDSLCKKGFEGIRNSTQSDLVKALTFGQQLGSWNCQFEGARGGMYKITEPSFKVSFSELIKQRNQDSDFNETIDSIYSNIKIETEKSVNNFYNQNFFCQSLFARQNCCS